MEKKGQFYIIAAVIIIMVLSGLVAVVNYARAKPEPVKFYDLSDQFYSEVSKVIDYGVINNQDVSTEIEKFTRTFITYSNSKEPGIDFVFVYGNTTGATIYSHNSTSSTDQSTISLDISGSTTSKTIVHQSTGFSKFFTTPINREVKLNIAGVVYNFTLVGEQQFFVVLTLDKNNETYIRQGG